MPFARCFAIGSLLLVASCDSESTQVTAVPPLEEAEQLLPVAQSRPVCERPNTGLWSHHNFPSSGYHGNITQCVDGVKVSLAIWTGEDILFGFDSQTCPDRRVEALDARNQLSDIREDRQNIAKDVKIARRKLEQGLARFRSQCGLPEIDVEGALKEFDSAIEEEVRRSWIQNRYGELRYGGPRDEKLLEQARSDYEKLR